MVDSYASCSSAISLCLLILSILEIIFTLVPLLALPDFLRFTGTHLAAVCGLIAGLITLPSSIRLKFNETSPDLHGHTSFFKKITMFLSLILNIVAATLTIIALLKLKNFQHDFGRLMKVYHCNKPARILVNWIQLTFDCCGALCYKDWLSINWKIYEISNDDSVIEEDNPLAVPYSCCNKDSVVSCGHYDLKTYGTCTINKHGCAKILRKLTKQYLWILFTLYMINIALQLLLLVIYFSNNQTNYPDRRKGNIQTSSKTKNDYLTQYTKIIDSPWDEMSNCSNKSDRNRYNSSNTSGYSLDYDETPELTSSHKQVYIYSPFEKSKGNIKISSVNDD